MPAINYMKEIAPKYESGAKIHTIRKPRKDGRDPMPGQTLYQYTGQRTTACRKLGEDVCKRVRDITMWIKRRNSLPTIEIDGLRLNASHWDQFAKNDGFEDINEMVDWFLRAYPKHELYPFNGLLIQWRETDY